MKIQATGPGQRELVVAVKPHELAAIAFNGLVILLLALVSENCAARRREVVEPLIFPAHSLRQHLSMLPFPHELASAPLRRHE